MTDKIHGFAHTPNQSLSGGLVMYTATVTGVDLTATAGTEEVHAPALDKVIEILSTRAQPVLMGAVTATTFHFAVEHNDIFGDLTKFNTDATAALAAYEDGATMSVAAFTGF